MAVAGGSSSRNITTTYTPTITSSWTPINIGATQGIFGMAWIPFLNLWLVSIFRGLFASEDGFNWSARALGITLDGAQGFASDNTYVVLVSAPYNSGGTSILYSTDGGLWSTPTGSIGATGNRFFGGGGCAATNGSGAWVVGGSQNATYNNTLAHAASGPTSAWTADGSGFFSTACSAVAWGNPSGVPTWVAGGSGTNTLGYSTQTCPSGSSAWTAATPNPFTTSCNSIVWTGSNFLAIGVSSGAAVVATSTNGIAWTATSGAPTGMSAPTAITYSNYNTLTSTAAPLTNVTVALGSPTQNFANIYTNTITLAGGATITSSIAGSGESINLGTISITANNTDSLAIGNQAGANGQGNYDVAIGYQAANSNQGINSVAIGYQAGTTSQGAYSIALGHQAGFTGQQDYSIAIGYQAGYTGHGTGSIAIGYLAGYQDSIGPNSVAIGTQAGQYGLGTNSVAIGYLAGPTGSAYNNNIILNAQGSALSPGTGSAFYAAPVRQDSTNTTNPVFYNTTTKELTNSTIPSYFNNGYNTALVGPTLTVDAFTLIMQDSTKIVQIKAVTGTLAMYWSGITTYWNSPTAAVYYSSGAGTVTVTTSYTNIDTNSVAKAIGSGGDTMTFTLQDTTNSKVYQVTATKTAGSGCVFAVTRYV